MRPDARDAAHLWDMLSAAREALAIVDQVIALLEHIVGTDASEG